MLTASRLRKTLSYSKSTGLFRWRVRNSNRIRVGQIAGGIDDQGYRVIQLAGVKHYAQRLAVLYSTGRCPAGEVTFRNGRRGDTRWQNLRVA